MGYEPTLSVRWDMNRDTASLWNWRDVMVDSNSVVVFKFVVLKIYQYRPIDTRTGQHHGGPEIGRFVSYYF